MERGDYPLVLLNKIRATIGKGVNALGYVGMITTFALMMITAIDVILRSVATKGILGSYELTEQGMVILIFVGIAVFAVAKGHVRVDMFVNMFPRRIRLIIEFLINLIETGLIGFMAYSAWGKIFDDMAKGLATEVLRIPKWPFVIFMFLGLALFTVMLFIDALISLCEAFQDPEEENAVKAAE